MCYWTSHRCRVCGVEVHRSAFCVRLCKDGIWSPDQVRADMYCDAHDPVLQQQQQQQQQRESRR